jgi:hypothetical protein
MSTKTQWLYIWGTTTEAYRDGCMCRICVELEDSPYFVSTFIYSCVACDTYFV